MNRPRWMQAALGAALIVAGGTGLVGTPSWAAAPSQPATANAHPAMQRMLRSMGSTGIADRTQTPDGSEQMMARCSQMMDQMMDRMDGATMRGAPAQGSGG